MAPELAQALRSFESHSPEATEGLGEQLGRHLPPGSVLTLDGDLGSGKTALVRGLARGLGIPGPISSPSYTLMVAHGTAPVAEADSDCAAPRCPLYHYDAWMEGREKAFLSQGGAEWFHADGIAAIEWGARLGPLIPDEHLALELSHRGPAERAITLRARGAGLVDCLVAIRAMPDLKEVREL
ncbi:MAG: tRNA (adenosine(37)-N6)-threonylcarbamoyltransferase complex ATPase subunit type 1 TsaE [Planctomycetota bacterium]|jgi:tRNA threonylcarbamoyladenosine biosynthesis protein TsaE|nr:tRNA (adenosine(37)-N6)-threonylcarbamoyltransferase complex ATPase subunit type 1 TsaE [Planctomycetota bacterium]MDP6367978.1 tRNA (adenosine(37)-N6)-threonylcarbamoyltransferase complex ATPase subunit type 1 TsaE [Planctomycetota bacterium]MDP6837907.1 tRNA (adenosine(37)-N6)-threonylcarbamoyltransferase complex ATPase subunit type 1 TsaE [Planctomycetota bacterium]